MAAYALPAPGTEHGPCSGECIHRDCASSRKEAEKPCDVCGEPVGYETLIYFLPDEKIAHAACEIKRSCPSP